MIYDPEDLILDIMQNMMSGGTSKEAQNSVTTAM